MFIVVEKYTYMYLFFFCMIIYLPVLALSTNRIILQQKHRYKYAILRVDAWPLTVKRM